VLSSGGSSVTYAQAIGPGILGDRVAGIALYFERFKFNRLKFELRAKLPTTTPGTCVSAVSDDATVNATTQAQMLDYRTSMERHIYQDMVLTWTPIDRSKWYYTAGVTGEASVDRFVLPCSYFVQSDTGLTGSEQVYSFDLHYSVTFEGACESGYSLVSPPPPATASPS
jgi:hypothetical protein